MPATRSKPSNCFAKPSVSGSRKLKMLSNGWRASHALAVDPQGRLFVSDTSRIIVIDATGKALKRSELTRRSGSSSTNPVTCLSPRGRTSSKDAKLLDNRVHDLVIVRAVLRTIWLNRFPPNLYISQYFLYARRSRLRGMILAVSRRVLDAVCSLGSSIYALPERV